MDKKDKILLSEIKRYKQEEKHLHIITRGYVIFVLSIYPLYVTSEGYNNIVYRKAQLYWTITILFFVVFGLFYLVYILGKNINSNQPKWYKSFKVSDWALFSFLIIITISFVLSQYKNIAWLGLTNRYDGYLTMLCLILSFFIISRFYEPHELDFTLFAVSSIILCTIGFLQFYGYDFLRLFPYDADAYIDSNGNPLYSGFTIIFRSTIGNIDFVSAYVCMAIIAFGILYIKKDAPISLLYLAAAVSNFIFMIIGGADAGKIGVFVSAIFLIPYWAFKKKSLAKMFFLISACGISYVIHHWFMINIIIPNIKDDAPYYDRDLPIIYKTLPLSAVLLFSAIALFAGTIIYFIKTSKNGEVKSIKIVGAIILFASLTTIIGVEILGKHLTSTNVIYQAREILHGNIDDSFGGYRIYVWKRALARVPYIPFFGTGQDTFYYAYGELNQSDAAAFLHEVFDKAHNDLIQILLCNGILGLGSYLAFIISLFIQSLKKACDNTFLLLSFGVVIAYFFQALFSIDTVLVTPIYWFMLALMRNCIRPSPTR